MISIAVSAQRVFTLPADLATTMAYFGDFERTIRDLDHLSLVKTYAKDQYRILYSAAEAGIFRVAFYCDLQVQFDILNQAIRVMPLPGIPPVSPKVTISSMTGQGYYTSQSFFQSAGPNTVVQYAVEIKAEVPKRLELKLVPDQVVKHVVENLVSQRLQAITNGFIVRSTEGLLQAAQDQ
jgi:hypothetical protein